MNIQPIRLTKKDTAKALGLSTDGLDKLMKRDSTFPRAYKFGSSMQSKSYFDYCEILKWHESQKLMV
ncbi:MAG: hypothetical protein KBT36_05980 [Kurthia sp.]|jgi:predicted DNA-binding transcriptional regulator AlpA|uniref:Transcriptional regulator n=1 Tax=Acinetobacter radioresistens TaxID=40216 RepID=A0A8H2K0A9_ACIRA|nr:MULTISPECIES: hypothetical protein [Acinetobacter]MBQ0138825.1 hypothetical protein [Candidatus Kurthia equi]EXB30455.1 hypothetical protein J546_2962 [Acinetobacter sp. 1461402]KCX36441.1 hypothetical protein J577_2410 [Acinetobacter sp. 263903-1]MDP1443834.1 transcriptional regulator [Acinetobacter schindleri]RSB52098.1 transcriptional regulator [Acinetobacter soli]